jgi:hypothetical protein
MAFMVDTFHALELGEGAAASDAPDYPWTWSGRRTAGAGETGADEFRDTATRTPAAALS